MIAQIFSERTFIVTIGNYGSVVTLHNGKKIEQAIFFEAFTEESKKDLAKLFTEYKSAPIYFLLDTVDQSYKKKTYPFIRKGDLIHLIKRDIANDADKESLKNYIILGNGKYPKNTQIADKKWECLFVSSSSSETTNAWLDFALEMPNRTLGIYMSPIETFSLFKLLKANIKSSSKISSKKNDLYCLLLQNKVSGIRQTVFSNDGIIFTRVVNYNFEEPNFLEKYEQDIHSTFEYLKRLFPNLHISELDIINIFPTEILTKLDTIPNIDFHFVNYTPFQAASISGYNKLIAKDSNFCDLLIAKIFASNKKKLLKFITPKITILENLFLIIRSSYYLNLLLLMIIGVICLFAINDQNDIEESRLIVEIQRQNVSQSLVKIKNAALDGEVFTEANTIIDIDRILDIGKMNDVIGSIGVSVPEIYSKLKFIKEYGVKLTSFSYSILNFTYKSPSAITSYKVSLSGEISNRSGDIEDLFTEFDGLTAELKKTFDKNKLSYSELPRNIDFTKKYYDFPIDFSITKN